MKLPPSLLYLVIYNPTLPPPQSANPHDEDAEEQAHVLFYTANNHAVSKDRVLRQVGLAKAMANFTTIFDPHAICESIHSQSRRMVMLCPEPGFWILACFELEKSLRVSRKEDSKGKGKQKEPVYDHNETSLHDTALRTLLLHGYEAFKVTHGSFTSILKNLGKEALELQLERFFTVWAWSWDLGRQLPFSAYLGIRVHPLSNQLMPLVDTFEDKLPPHYYPLVLVSSCIVASKATPAQWSSSLIRYLIRILDSRAIPQQTTTDTSSVSSENDPESTLVVTRTGERKHARTVSKSYLGVPTLNINMNVNMDVRKWNWPGYLTFGIGGSSSGPKIRSTSAYKTEEGKPLSVPVSENQEGDDDKHSAKGSQDPRAESEITVDTKTLEDALSSEVSSQTNPSSEDSARKRNDDTQSNSFDPEALIEHKPPSSGSASPNPLSSPTDQNPKISSESLIDKAHSSILPPPFSFSELHVHLSDSDHLDTHRRLVRYLCMDNMLIALVPSVEMREDNLDATMSQDIAERSVELIERLKDIVDVEEEKIATAFSSSPVQDMLQKSQHVIAAPDGLSYSSASFSATSWHLHEGRRVLGMERELLEIYSRGQNPQDWHLAKRGPEGSVYMEIGRKEASLVDVDSEIMGVLRRFGE